MDEVKHGETNCAVSVQQRHAIELPRHVHPHAACSRCSGRFRSINASSRTFTPNTTCGREVSGGRA